MKVTKIAFLKAKRSIECQNKLLDMMAQFMSENHRSGFSFRHDKREFIRLAIETSNLDLIREGIACGFMNPIEGIGLRNSTFKMNMLYYAVNEGKKEVVDYLLSKKHLELCPVVLRNPPHRYFRLSDSHLAYFFSYFIENKKSEEICYAIEQDPESIDKYLQVDDPLILSEFIENDQLSMGDLYPVLNSRAIQLVDDLDEIDMLITHTLEEFIVTMRCRLNGEKYKFNRFEKDVFKGNVDKLLSQQNRSNFFNIKKENIYTTLLSELLELCDGDRFLFKHVTRATIFSLMRNKSFNLTSKSEFLSFSIGVSKVNVSDPKDGELANYFCKRMLREFLKQTGLTKISLYNHASNIDKFRVLLNVFDDSPIEVMNMNKITEKKKKFCLECISPAMK